METGLVVVLCLALAAGVLLVIFNSVSTEAVKYRKNIEHIHFDDDTPLTEDEFMRRLSLLQLDKYWQKLSPFVKHEIAIEITPCQEDALMLGNSKTGGFPHLPKGESLPVDLILLAQINCAQAKEFDKDNLLPKEGMLYFFIDPEKIDEDIKDAVSVRYISLLNGLPLQKADISPEAESGLMQFSQRISLPEYDSDTIQVMLKDYEIDGYFKLTNKEHSHKLLGYPDTITQNFIIDEEKVLLLQLDSEESCRLSWGNMGKLYVFIDKNKLNSLQFDDLYVHIQSYEQEKE